MDNLDISVFVYREGDTYYRHGNTQKLIRHKNIWMKHILEHYALNK